VVLGFAYILWESPSGFLVLVTDLHVCNASPNSCFSKIITLTGNGYAVLSVHDQTTGDVDRLPGHVCRPLGGEEADDAGHVFRTLHASERHLCSALTSEVLG
jgi:hypothetical protein